ncbi:phosphoglucosamine mutase [Candidatus Saccharibacteria bacterium]|nr:phosphoglucosamine mutase [Candidatus Saccharibacteria bacterium]
MDRLFGTDGIRGVAGEYPLNQVGCVQIGKAIGKYFASTNDTIVIGYDPRESSVDISSWVIEGLNTVGVNTVVVGVIPTPGLAYLTRTMDVVAGVMITASHNPFSDNGIKVFDKNGGKLPDDTEDKLNDLINSEIPSVENTGVSSTSSEGVSDYEDYLVESSNVDFSGTKILLDSANGATSKLAGRVFTRLGFVVETIFDAPDGKNINEGCGATDIKKLSELVKSGSYDAGAAFDGDGDRLIMVDEMGRELDGDTLMYVLAVSNNHKQVVATVMSNKGFENSLESKGIKLKRTAVGDRYVLEGLEETGAKLGGEQSGHIVLPDLATTGDGLLAAIQVMSAVVATQKKLSAWKDEVKLLPQATVNIKLQNKKLLELYKVKEFISAQEAIIGAEGRLLIRPSGTEPKVRVMVEADGATDKAEKIARELELILNEEQK